MRKLRAIALLMATFAEIKPNLAMAAPIPAFTALPNCPNTTDTSAGLGTLPDWTVPIATTEFINGILDVGVYLRSWQ